MIERSEQDGILTLKLAHGKVSALDLELLEALSRALIEAGESDARAVILTGTGSSFSAGVDLFRIVDGGPDYVEQFYPALSRMCVDLFSLAKPVVAAVNGHAIAGGAVMAFAADYKLMVADKARIGVPELLAGVPLPPSVIEVLRFALPPQHLQAMVYTGRTVTASEAQQQGLIDEAVTAEALLPRALEVATQLAALPPEGFRLAKRQLRDKALTWSKRYIGEFDRDAMAHWKTPETHARIRDYLARTVRK
ncbi:MAG TPA: enoyl-CoA hydratase/isomerase family protein [Thermoanaerobaculia bacterium]|jgi:enoyl-CoA hydratase